MGPRGMREGSTLYSFGLDGAYDIEKDIMYLGPDCKVVDCGDVDMVHGDLEQSFENVEESIRKIVCYRSNTCRHGRRSFRYNTCW